jgi:DNA-binding CsgD family transcriptional regulator
VGADLEAIEIVCADDVPIALDGGGSDIRLARSEVRELLNRLVEQSLVSIHLTADTVRYFLLESLRLFAAERLTERSTEHSEEARLAERHRCYYRDKVLHAQSEWFGPAEEELLTWAMGAWSNIRRAIDASLAAGEPVVGLQIAVGVLALRAPFVIGSLPEIRGRIEKTLAATQSSESQLSELQLAALGQTAWLALVQGHPQEAEGLLERCVAACDVDVADAGRWRDRPEIDIGLPAVVDYAWGIELMLARRDPRAIAVLGRAGEKFDGIADRGGAAMSQSFEALAAGFFGSPGQAMGICQHQLERTTVAGSGIARSWAQMALAIALTKHGDTEGALTLGREALAYQLPLGDQWGPNWAVHIRMWSLTRLITDHIAAKTAPRSALVRLASEIAYLAGGVKAQRARLGVLIENLGPYADETIAAEAVARDVLGQETYASIEKSGAPLFFEGFELERIALGTWSIDISSREHAASNGPPSWQGLTAAEQEVAILAAAGWPNSAIAVRRGTSTKTTDAQMSSILQKLLISSREDIAGYVPQDQRDRVLAERAQSRNIGSIPPRPQG